MNHPYKGAHRQPGTVGQALIRARQARSADTIARIRRVADATWTRQG